MAEQKVTAIGVVVILVIVGVIALICTSYSDLQYYEIGFIKSKTTGNVDTSKVWGSGRHWVGPDKTFKAFPASAHTINLAEVTVFAAPDSNQVKAGSGGSLSITVGVEIIYFLKGQNLKQLHDAYDLQYETVIKNSAQAAIKDGASKYKLEQFYTDREEVERGLHSEVALRLGGNKQCCSKKCNGLFVDVKYFQMTDLKIPSDVERRNLKALLLTEETARETFKQQAAVIEKETERQVVIIENQADEVKADATARSRLVEARSKASYEKILEDARREGLTILFNSINLQNATYKNSFDYLRSLASHQNAHLTVNFDQLITGPTKWN